MLLGIDLSTTGAKALLIDHDGRVVSSATTPLNLSSPHPLWSEQDPREWWTATTNSIAQVLAAANASGNDVVAIGLTGQMHGLVLLDDRGEVLRPAILWNDQRCGAECDEIRARESHHTRRRIVDRSRGSPVAILRLDRRARQGHASVLLARSRRRHCLKCLP